MKTEVKTRLAATLAATLGHFTGSTCAFKHPLTGVRYTEGVRYLAETAGCYWWIDKIAACQLLPALRGEAFQAWKLTVDVAKSTGVLRVEDGNGGFLYDESLTFTDFPLPELTLWFTDNTILLPSEY